MKATDRTIIYVIAGLGLVVAFWFLLLSPKRSELSKLDEERNQIQSAVTEQEELASSAQEAESAYADNYGELVSIGKAVPTDDDTSSLVVQTSDLAKAANIKFHSLTLASSGEAGDAAAATPAATPPTEEAAPEGEAAPPAETAQPTAAPATEESAATLPIGATVGSAGLPVMPYDLVFRGQFFDIADFMESLDSLVKVNAAGTEVRGRLFTVDGFSFVADEARGFPYLQASMHVTSFLTPADQGATGGATAEAPPATLSASPVPVSSP